MTSMTFHLHLANHANKKGLFPVMLRMTQNRKSKRLRTLVEVRTAEWNKNKECVRASNPNSEWMNEVLEKELRMAKDVYLNLRNRGMDTPEKVKDSMKRGKRSPSFMVYAKERFAKMAKEKRTRQSGGESTHGTFQSRHDTEIYGRVRHQTE